MAGDDLNGYETTTRGFTGHEHLNGTELIHMNGRAYDYNLGRFLSVDPVIQFPANSQSLNPYSYIMNNPMAGTDPSGYTIAGAGAGAIKSVCEEKPSECKAKKEKTGSTTAKCNSGSACTVTQINNGSSSGQTTNKGDAPANLNSQNHRSQNGSLDKKGQDNQNMPGDDVLCVTIQCRTGLEQPSTAGTAGPSFIAARGPLLKMPPGGNSVSGEGGFEIGDFTENLLGGGGIATGGAAIAYNGQGIWLGINGKLYSYAFNGNGATKGRNFAIANGNAINFGRVADIASRGFFFADVFFRGVDSGVSIYTGESTFGNEFSRQAPDIAFGALATFGGPPGLVIGGAYFIGEATGINDAIHAHTLSTQPARRETLRNRPNAFGNGK